jgi:replicative DNA helicase
MQAEQPRREYRPQTLRALPAEAGEIEAPPPVNADAERSVIGAILLRPELIREIDGTLDATDFYYDRHRIMFAALREMADRGDGIDTLTLEAELSRAGLLDAIGGPVTDCTSHLKYAPFRPAAARPR